MAYLKVQIAAALEAQAGKNPASAKLSRCNRVPEVQRLASYPQFRLPCITDFGFSFVVALTSLIKWALSLKAGFV
jgi:hypothetical protein